MALEISKPAGKVKIIAPEPDPLPADPKYAEHLSVPVEPHHVNGGKKPKEDLLKEVVEPTIKKVVVHNNEDKNGVLAKANIPIGEQIEVKYTGGIPAELLCHVAASGTRKFMLEYYGGMKYESADVFVSFSAPCTMETRDAVYQDATDWVSSKIDSIAKGLKKGA